MSNQTVVVELAPFRLKPGVTDDVVARASEALQRDFLSSQPGFLKRELLRGPDGNWMDLVYWADGAAAQRVMAVAMEDPVCLEYFKIMEGMEHADAASAVQHFSRFRTYG
jgi:hypothetical protein